MENSSQCRNRKLWNFDPGPEKNGSVSIQNSLDSIVKMAPTDKTQPSGS